MNTAFDVRRENLRRLILDKFEGNRAAFSRAAGVHQNQINLILTDNLDHRRNLGEGLARRIEVELGLGPGYLDQPAAGRGGAAHTITSSEVPHAQAHILRRDDTHESVTLYDSFFEQLAGKISSKESLAMFRVATRDMEPQINQGDHVLVDTGVKTATVDGVYIIGRGDDLFLRQVTKKITGGWVIHTPGTRDDPVKVDNLKGLRVVGRVVMVSQHVVL